MIQDEGGRILGRFKLKAGAFTSPIADAKRVLVYRLGSLGDTLVAIPSLRLIARAFPVAERRMLTNTYGGGKTASAESILENCGLIDGYFTYPANSRNLRELWKLRREIAMWAPDVLVYLAAPRGKLKAYRDALFFKMCGIPLIVGVPFTDDQQHVRVVSSTLFESESARLARSISEFGDARLDNSESWELNLTDAEIARANALVRPVGPRYVALSVGAKIETKDWGKENWRELIARLASLKLASNLGLAVVGAEDERDLGEWVTAGWSNAKVNLCGQTSPRVCAAVLADASLFIGHDSGPMHLAASVGTSCVAVFGAQNKPGEWFPRGSNHHVIYHQTECYGCRLTVCRVHQKKCLTSISVEEVLAAISDRLAERQADKTPRI